MKQKWKKMFKGYLLLKNELRKWLYILIKKKFVTLIRKYRKKQAKVLFYKPCIQ